MEIQVNAGRHENGIACVVLEVTEDFTQYRLALDSNTARNLAAGLTEQSIIAEELCKNE